MNEKYMTAELSELEALKAQAIAIQKRIEELSAPTSIASMCERKPFCLPMFECSDSRNPVVFRDYVDQDAWKCFLSLGKRIHAKNGVFVQRGARNWQKNPFFVDETKKFTPCKVSDLSKEEARRAAEMIDRMVEIYNEYMVKLHTQVVLVDEYGNSRIVMVQKPIEGLLNDEKGA